MVTWEERVDCPGLLVLAMALVFLEESKGIANAKAGVLAGPLMWTWQVAEWVTLRLLHAGQPSRLKD